VLHDSLARADTTVKIRCMAELSIPPEFEQGFIALRHLDEDQVQELASALKGEQATLRRTDLRRRVRERVSGIAPDEVNGVLIALVSLYPLRDDMASPIPDVLDAICDAMEESDNDELHFSGQADRTRFKDKLILLLDTESLEVTAKATNLLTEFERTVHGKPRVLTDIRPVFGTFPDDPPIGAVIVHTLKFDYHQDGQVREFFITLDTDQVADLVDVLARAKLKAGSLKQVLAKAEIRPVAVGEEGSGEDG
jgi:hypothetical protein